jgi:hypothetical protein
MIGGNAVPIDDENVLESKVVGNPAPRGKQLRRDALRGFPVPPRSNADIGGWIRSEREGNANAQRGTLVSTRTATPKGDGGSVLPGWARNRAQNVRKPVLEGIVVKRKVQEV